MFGVRNREAECTMSREELLAAVECGRVSPDASIRSYPYFGDGEWHAIRHCSIWQMCRLPARPEAGDLPALRTDSLDLVPVSIEPGAVARAGVEEPYLLDLCRRHSVCRRDLYRLIGFRTEFATNFIAISRLLERAFTLDEIEALYEAREHLRACGGASLLRLGDFYRTFLGGTEASGSYIAALLLDARRDYDPDLWLDSLIRRLCDLAHRYDCADFEFALGRLCAMAGT